MINPDKTTLCPLRQRPALSLKESYRVLRHLPLGGTSDGELEQISDQVSQLDSQLQIRALMAHLPRR